MTDVQQAVYRYLDDLGISYRIARHERTASIDECARIGEALGAVIPKNLFLSTRNEKRFYLCIVSPGARFCTSDISRQAGSSRLSFAAEDKLWALMRTRPGSISPMGLLFDAEKRVELLVDDALRGEPTLGFHPCDNTETVAFSNSDFFDRFLPSLQILPKFVQIL